MDCHLGATPRLASYKVHAAFSTEKSAAQYYFRLFFYILTGGVLLPIMGIMFLDLVRRLFPHASLRRRK
jgi:hypothetical protein